MNFPLRLATYNVHRFFDAVDEPEKRDALYPKPEESVACLAEVLKDSGADVISLQEVETTELLTEFRDKYGLANRFPHLILVEGNDKKGIDVALMSRYPIKSFKSHKDRVIGYDKGEPQYFRRDLLQADLELPEMGTLRVFCTHFIAQGNDWCDARRQEEARATRQIVEEEQQIDPVEHTAIMGDFNDVEGGPVLAALESDGMITNTTADAIPSWGAVWPTDFKARKFDHILVSPSLRSRQTGGGVLRHPLECWVSDHRMVYADINLAA